MDVPNFKSDFEFRAYALGLAVKLSEAGCLAEDVVADAEIFCRYISQGAAEDSGE